MTTESFKGRSSSFDVLRGGKDTRTRWGHSVSVAATLAEPLLEGLSNGNGMAESFASDMKRMEQQLIDRECTFSYGIAEGSWDYEQVGRDGGCQQTEIIRDDEGSSWPVLVIGRGGIVRART